jgi:hypothetical protein
LATLLRPRLIQKALHGTLGFAEGLTDSSAHTYKTGAFTLLLAMLSGCGADTATVDASSVSAADTRYIDFESFPLVKRPDWRADTSEYAGPFSESGQYYVKEGIEPPPAMRNSIPLGDDGWLVAELYTRNADPILIDYLDVIPDPSNPNNTVLELKSPQHTDGIILRSRDPLPEAYELSYRIGYADWGGEGKLNGYDQGDENSGPWGTRPVVNNNGFYWLAITDIKPEPHNNRWSHHHRKFHIDTWNNRRDVHGINIATIDGRGKTHMRLGKPFVFYDGVNWKLDPDIYPAEYYKPDEWYEVTFRRSEGAYSFSIRGDLLNHGQDTPLEGSINFVENCVFHYNQTIEEMDRRCVDDQSFVIMGKQFVHWPLDSAYPDYFMIGDPHINFYEGSLMIDDIRLKVL